MGVRLLLAMAFFAGAASAQALPDGKGKDTMELICSFCHPPTYVLDKAKTRGEWQQLVIEMLQEEEVSQEEKDEIVAYLAASFPRKVNVNADPAIDLEAVLGITARQAAAVVAYRANTPFKTLEEVKKVPGIDAAKVEAAKELVQF